MYKENELQREEGDMEDVGNVVNAVGGDHTFFMYSHIPLAGMYAEDSIV